jgi:nucleoside-diphosphate-sugar epimerase
MKVVIAGGGGFIGSSLLKRLAGKHHCLCFGHATRYGELRGKIRGEVEFVEGDLHDEELLRRVVRGADAVVHVAGSGGEVPCLDNPSRAVLTHVMGTHLLLGEVSRQNIPRFIFASTIAVYGTYRRRAMPLTEDIEPQPDDFYAALKATAERELIDAGRFQIFRLANVYGYGSGLHPLSSGVAGRFITAALSGEPLQVYGDGSQLIDYVHVDDVCEAFELALDKPGENFIYNLGGGEPVPVASIAELVAETARTEFKREAAVTYREAPPNKIWPDRWLCIEKAERELGWRPRVPMRAAVREMLERWSRQTGAAVEERHT